jgi:hypothetical protein
MNTACLPVPAFTSVVKLTFNAFSALRVVAYLPTAWAIAASADSAQHSLFTWCVFAGANATLAARLYVEQGRRMGACATVSTINALMCLLIAGLIGWYRA